MVAASVAVSAPAAALPAVEASSPAVVSPRTGRLDLFMRSPGGRLRHQYRPAGGSWTRRLDLGGDLASQPAAVSTAPGRIDVFARGRDDTLQHRSYTAGRWTRWKSLGGRLSSAPTAVSMGDGRLDVFARGHDGGLRHRWFTPSAGWSRWRSRGGALTSSPGVASMAPGRLDVFARGDEGTLQQRSYRRGRGWSAWRSLGGSLRSQPAVASPGSGSLDVVVRGRDGELHVKRYAAGRWSRWTRLAGATSSGPGVAVDGQRSVAAVRRAGGALWLSTRPAPAQRWSRWRRVDPHQPFRGLGTWIDVFDYGRLDPATAVRAMRAEGVRVLFLSTARFTSADDLHDRVEAGRWLDAAHAAGLRVVGWYVPAYGDPTRDVRRTLAIARFRSPGGQRFDAVAVDIERLDEVPRNRFNRLAAAHLARVRARTDAVIGAIVPSPYATDPGSNWEGFPWAQVGRSSDVVVPMALWSFRDSCPGPTTCAFTPAQVRRWVLRQIRRTRALTGRPVSVEGGVDDPGTERTPVTPERVAAFVDAAIAEGAIGGSHYDYLTTPPSLWPELRRLNRR